MSKTIELNDSTELDVIVKNGGVVVIDAHAGWCSPCKMMMPIYESISQEIDDATFLKLDCDIYQELAVNLNIKSIPCFIIYQNGVELDRHVGPIGKNALKEKIEGAIHG